MALAERVYDRALLLAGSLESGQETLLQELSAGAERSLRGKLREGITAEDCEEDFVTAAALYALAMLICTRGAGEAESFAVGDISVTCPNGDSAAKSLRDQADRLLAPYVWNGFSFRGV